jgi:hypothetical protein
VRIPLVIVAILAVLATAAPTLAEEVIERYVQTVRLTADDQLDVTEEITVRAEGDQIRRGIYRDFPTLFLDADDTRRQVPFLVLDVRRNGAEEPYTVRHNARGVRVYIGDENVFLSPGRYTYTLVYRTGRQVRRFADHDELFWNVTGNDWAFPIRSVEATIDLPPGAEPGEVTAYTGPAGARGRDWRLVSGRGGGDLTFITTRTLAPGEGFSVVVSLAKGVVAEPSAADQLRYGFLDYAAEILSLGGLGIVLAYYGIAWSRVGRDPPPGVVVPRWDPPAGISAPLAQYVHERGLTGGGWTALASGWVALAVRGLVTLDNTGKELAIASTAAKPPADLHKSERLLHDWLTVRGGSVVINRAIGPKVQSLIGDFRSAVHGESRETFFNNNRTYAFLGIILSFGALALAVMFSGTSADDLGGLMPLAVAGVFGTVGISSLLRAVRARGWSGRIGGIFTGVITLVLAASAAGGSVILTAIAEGSYVLPAVGLVLVLVNVLFYHLLSAPTANGRKLMDAIEGLILYMTVAEEKRLNMPGLPPVTPSRFETLLPYAVALGVEEPWTSALESELARAAAAGAATSYSPGWYHDSRGRSITSGLARNLSAMSGSFQSSVPPPKSSSSGFSSSSGSGGGGGGGGGGGW